MADIEAAIKRGREAGYSPTMASAMETLQRNQSRAAERQQAAAAALTSAALVQQRAGEKLALPLIVPAPKVTVINNVSATSVTHTTIQTRRYGRTGGSRQLSGPLEF